MTVDDEAHWIVDQLHRPFVSLHCHVFRPIQAAKHGPIVNGLGRGLVVCHCVQHTSLEDHGHRTASDTQARANGVSSDYCQCEAKDARRTSHPQLKKRYELGTMSCVVFRARCHQTQNGRNKCVLQMLHDQIERRTR